MANHAWVVIKLWYKGTEGYGKWGKKVNDFLYVEGPYPVEESEVERCGAPVRRWEPYKDELGDATPIVAAFMPGVDEDRTYEIDGVVHPVNTPQWYFRVPVSVKAEADNENLTDSGTAEEPSEDDSTTEEPSSDDTVTEEPAEDGSINDYEVVVDAEQNAYPYCRCNVMNGPVVIAGEYRGNGTYCQLKFTSDPAHWETGVNRIEVKGDAESLHAIVPHAGGGGVNVGTEQMGDGRLISVGTDLQAASTVYYGDGKNKYLLGGAVIDGEQYFGASSIRDTDQSRIVQYNDGWKIPDIPAVTNENGDNRLIWGITKFLDKLVVAGSWASGYTDQNAGWVGSWGVGDSGWTTRYPVDGVTTPDGVQVGRGWCKQVKILDGKLFAFFGGGVAATEDMVNWTHVPVEQIPGLVCWNVEQVSDTEAVGIWYTGARFKGDRYGKTWDYGVWICALNFKEMTMRTLKHLPASCNNQYPYEIGGGLVRFSDRVLAGFYNTGGKGIGLKFSY